MFYEIVIISKANIILESKKSFKTFKDADIYFNLHKVEIDPASQERMAIVTKELEEFENIPNFHYVVVQTYSENNDEPFNMENRFWSVEEVAEPSTYAKKLKEGTALVEPDDAAMQSSYTIIFPINTSTLLENEISRDGLIEVAKNIFIERSKDREIKSKEKYVIENFDPSKY